MEPCWRDDMLRQNLDSTRDRRRVRRWALASLCLLLWTGPGLSSAAAQVRGPSVEPPLIYGGDAYFPPYEYLDKEGQPQGYTVDLVKALAARVGRTVEFRLGHWTAVRPALDRGEIDLTSMAWSDARAARYAFVFQTNTLHTVLLFHANRSSYPDSLDQLATERLALLQRSLVQELILDLPEVRRPVLLGMPTQRDALVALLAGKATAAAGNRLTMRHAQRELEASDLEEVTVKSLEYYLVTRRESAQTFGWIPEVAGQLEREGTITRLTRAHLSLPTAPVSWKRQLASARPLLAIVALVGVAAFAWVGVLRRQVRMRTLQLAGAFREQQALAVELQKREHDAPHRLRRRGHGDGDRLGRGSIPRSQPGALRHAGLPARRSRRRIRRCPGLRQRRRTRGATADARDDRGDAPIVPDAAALSPGGRRAAVGRPDGVAAAR